jgi:adenylosuccinate lyase
VVVGGMRGHPERMRENLELTHGAIFSQSVLTRWSRRASRADDRVPDRPARARRRPGTSGVLPGAARGGSRRAGRLDAKRLDELFDYAASSTHVPTADD